MNIPCTFTEYFINDRYEFSPTTSRTSSHCVTWLPAWSLSRWSSGREPGLGRLFIFIAGIFDFLDGTAARVLDARSEMGKQLDSLADVVSFGVAPGIIIFTCFRQDAKEAAMCWNGWDVTPYFALLIPLMSALRLAKFNIDSARRRTSSGCRRLPMPSSSLRFPLVVLLGAPVLSAGSGLNSTAIFFQIPVHWPPDHGAHVLPARLRFPDVLAEIQILGLAKGTNPGTCSLSLRVLLLVMFSVGGIPLSILAYFLLSLVFQKQFR